MQRRDFVRSASIAGIAGIVGLPPAAATPAVRTRPLPVGRARNIVFFVYDGFGFEDLATARFFAQRFARRDPLALERLLGTGATGLMLPHSLDSLVTDSAAASSAWSTGRKVANRFLSMTPAGDPLTTILEVARAEGRATGLVTTTRLTHATPAGWVARIHDRNLEDEIALQYLDFAPDVMLGGGSNFFDPRRRRDGRDLFRDFAAQGYDVLRTGEDLQRSNGSRLFGAFTPDHLPYEIDRRYQGSVSPSLAELTSTALRVLDGSDSGFVLQIEAGRVDHANHQNDPGGMVWDVLAADEALEEVIRYVDRNPETLLIVTSDHATGSGAVYGVGSAYSGSDEAFARLDRRRASQEYVLRQLGSRPTAAAIAEAARTYFDVRVGAGEAELAASALAGEVRVTHPAHGSERSPSLHHVLTTSQSASGPLLNVHYATGAHTAGPVPLIAYGAGTSREGLGVVDNTELFTWMTAALGTQFENPVFAADLGPELLAVQMHG